MIQIQLNRRNKLNNFKKDVDAGKKMKLQQGDRTKQSQINDPFIRRETRPLNLWNTGAKLESEKQKESLKRDLDKLKSEGYGNSDEAKDIEAKLEELNKSGTANSDIPTKIDAIVPNIDEIGGNSNNFEYKYGRISLEEVSLTSYYHIASYIFIY